MLSHQYVLFLDTETSDKPKNWNSKDERMWPYIVQAAWLVCDLRGNKLVERNVIIRPDDFEIKQRAEHIHGISEDLASREGISRKEALRRFTTDLRHYKPLIVGHFIELDLRMVQMGLKRAGMKNILAGYQTFCTMRGTSEYMHLPNRHYPQLGEIYQMLFKRKLQGAHNALVDVNATAEVFFELLRRGEVSDQIIQQQHRMTENKEKKTGCGLALFLILLTLIQLWVL
ncbi:3'-5' exonuclease [Fulvivirga sedimenti]|uniref:3'-5' exonuclease n=1 Tax=Fulvivirga sedimenti TaxID=2879465 RepID=A0A9X1HK43_9BACT|nr:3'-5' exonuclease [Fulvivirga sedimenti]MCA6073266.1 3'-5' exonuclease [Fulvivirga sedimenti]